jgi:hypothetical protein
MVLGSAAAAPAPHTSSSAPSFVGIWYGEGEPADVRVLYIDAYHADGTFNSEFRKCEKGRLVWKQTESGTWSAANGVLTMSAKTIDGKPATYDNSYQIESLTGTEFHARLHDPDYLFVEKRVAAFEFPPCYVGA